MKANDSDPTTRFTTGPISVAVAALLALPACGDDTKPTADTTPGDTTTDTTPEDTAPDTTPGDTTPNDTALDTSPEDVNDVADVPPVTWPAIVLNEIAPAGEPTDWFEIFNPTASPVTLDGWYFSDNDPTHVFTFPNGTTLAAGGYLAFGEGVDGFGFGLGAADSARLFAPDGTVIDEVSWTAESLPRAANLGRFPNGSGDFVPLYIPTRAAENVANPETFCGNLDIEALEICDGTNFGADSCEARGWGGGSLSCEDQCTRIDTSSCTARESGLVINEVTSAGDDSIELFNGSGTGIDLANYTLRDEGGGTYLIPPDTVIPAGGYIVFVKDVHHTFGLGGADAVELLDPDGTIVDRVAWASGQAVVSYCRKPNGTGGFTSCPSASFGGENF